MVQKEQKFTIPYLPERSILYVSANASSDHPMRQMAETTDPPPDLDLNRIVRCLGTSSRRYFVESVIDGTQDPIPENLSKYCGLIIGCSAHSANLNKCSLTPWQERLIKLIRTAILDYDIPFLGLCGGGQLGLIALGGEVGSNPPGVGFTPEQEGSLLIRTTEIELTEAGLKDPLFEGCKPRFGMTAIHADYMKEAPIEKGFVVLANSNDIPNQVVAYGDRVRLIGLHPEINRSFLEDTTETIIQAGGFLHVSRNELRKALAEISPEPDSNYLILKNFLSHFCTRRYRK